MRVVVWCEECGHENPLEREILWPQTIRLVCHKCELPITVPVELVAAEAERRARAIA